MLGHFSHATFFAIFVACGFCRLHATNSRPTGFCCRYMAFNKVTYLLFRAYTQLQHEINTFNAKLVTQILRVFIFLTIFRFFLNIYSFFDTPAWEKVFFWKVCCTWLIQNALAETNHVISKMIHKVFALCIQNVTHGAEGVKLFALTEHEM